VLAELVPVTHFKDAVTLYDIRHVGRLNRPLVEAPANFLLDVLYAPFFAVWGAILVLLALRGRRRALALAFVVVLPLAPLSAELLKPLLAHSHDQLGAARYIAAASWPSGHSSAAAVLAWCAVLVAPPARRRTVALLAVLFALAVGVALLVLAWHMPSDVLGGYLLATLWVAGAVAVLCGREARRGRGQPADQASRARLGGVSGAVRAGSP
jgi:membrane-associated phospholipid phosphatase